MRVIQPCVNLTPRVARSSRGLGRRPLTPVARVRIPYGLPPHDSRKFHIVSSGQLNARICCVSLFHTFHNVSYYHTEKEGCNVGPAGSTPISECLRGGVEMPKLNRLPAVFIKSAPPGRHFDGGNLHLYVRSDGTRSWVFRYVFNGRRRDLGLGPYPDVSLAVAREDALQARRWLRAGEDPRVERKREEKVIPTFDEAAERYVVAHAAGWSDRHAKNWASSLNIHASPVVGERVVDEITLADVLAVLTPLWNEKTETASRVRQRMEKVLDACAVHGERSTENPARWRGNLAAVLPAPRAVSKVGISELCRGRKSPHSWRSSERRRVWERGRLSSRFSPLPAQGKPAGRRGMRSTLKRGHGQSRPVE